MWAVSENVHLVQVGFWSIRVTVRVNLEMEGLSRLAKIECIKCWQLAENKDDFKVLLVFVAIISQYYDDRGKSAM